MGDYCYSKIEKKSPTALPGPLYMLQSCGLLQILWSIYNLHLLDKYHVFRAIHVVSFACGDGIHDFDSLDYLTKHGVLTIEERCPSDGGIGFALLLAHSKSFRRGGCGLTDGVDQPVGLFSGHGA